MARSLCASQVSYWASPIRSKRHSLFHLPLSHVHVLLCGLLLPPGVAVTYSVNSYDPCHCYSADTYLCEPMGLGAPTSPSAILTAATEKERLREVLLALRSGRAVCLRNIVEVVDGGEAEGGI